MDDLLLTVFNSCFAKLAKAGTPIAPGSYTVDETVTIRVAGTVEKKPDEIYTQTISVPWLAVLALFLEKMRGVVQENQKAALVEMVIECMTKALNADTKADPILKACLDDLKAAEAKVREMMDALPPGTRTGKTMVDCTLVVAPAATAAVTVP